ncbi:MAG: hypothetical protein QW324_08470, partial [Thermofilaceae archaeon]
HPRSGGLWGGVVGAEGVHGEAARAIEEALRALREIEERVARESLMEAKQLIERAMSMYRDLLARSPALREAVMERIARASEMLAAVEQALEELEGGG